MPKKTVTKEPVKEIKKNPLERHIQNVLAQKLDEADEKIIADAIKTMLYQAELEKNIH